MGGPRGGGVTIAKRIVDMTRGEVLKDFEGGEVVFRARRRPRKLVPLTLRVHPDLIRVLGEEAKRRGVSGHTTMARILLEAAVARPQKSLAEEIADTVVARLRRRRVAGA
jgi:hypothetical protein